MKTLTSPTGRPYRISGVEKVPDSEKGYGYNVTWEWIEIIKYLDDNTFAKLYYNRGGKVTKVEKL